MKKRYKTGQIVLIGLLVLLTVLGIVCEIRYYLSMKGKFLSGASFDLIAYIAMSMCLIYYVFYNYKKPHGNLLKYLYLIFAVVILAGVVSIKSERNMLDNIFNYVRGVVALLTAYISGRLDRFEDNSAIMIIILLLMLGTSILSNVYLFIVDGLTIDFWSVYDCYDSFILSIDLFLAYMFRFSEHRKAGIESADNKM